MAREILFRAKATNREEGREYRTNYQNGDWVYGLITDTKNYYGYAQMINTDGVNGIDVDPNTLGQYTGLKDKNGNKIYEGDIVLFNKQKGKIVYESGSFGIAIEESINYKRIEKFTKDNLDNTFDGTFCDNFIPLFELYWNFNNVDDYIDEIEVVGNIYD